MQAGQQHAGFLLVFMRAQADAEQSVQELKGRYPGLEDPHPRLAVYRQLAGKGLVLLIPFDRLFRQGEGASGAACSCGLSTCCAA